MNGLTSKRTRRRAVTLFAALLASTALIGCSGEKSGTDAPKAPAPVSSTVEIRPGDPAAGKEIYLTHCHFCHGRTGRGEGPVGIAISPSPADFIGDKSRMAKSDADLFESISKGIYKEAGKEEMAMPRWQDVLTEQERWDVLAYVRQLVSEGLAAEKNKHD